jgi:hypothetical protein
MPSSDEATKAAEEKAIMAEKERVREANAKVSQGQVGLIFM